MWHKEILNLDMFFIFYSLLIFSFGGWIWETSKCSIEQKTFINRGFLNGPIIPIYGVGGTLVYMLLLPFKPYILLIFVLGMVLATVLEYITAAVMEQLFHAKWWDYSDYKYNIQGRISLIASLFWGVLSVLDIYVLGPFVKHIVDRIPRTIGENAGVLIFIVFAADFTVTVVYTVQLSNYVMSLAKLREELLSYLLNTRLVEKTSELKEAFQTASIGKLQGKKDAFLSELVSRFKASLGKELEPNQVEERVGTFRSELDSRVKNFTAKYKLDSTRMNMVHKRLIKAFPNLTFTKGRYYLQELKERLNSHGTKVNNRENEKRKQ